MLMMRLSFSFNGSYTLGGGRPSRLCPMSTMMMRVDFPAQLDRAVFGCSKVPGPQRTTRVESCPKAPKPTR